MDNALLKNSVRFEADGVEETFCFQERVDVRCGKGGIPSEVTTQVPFPVTLNDRFQNIPSSVSAVDVAGPQGASFQITELVEQE